MVVANELVKAAEEVQEEAGFSEPVASEAHKGNIVSPHTTEIVNIESSTSYDSRSNPAFLSTSSSTSYDMDDIPLNRVYENLNKRLSLSSSTKTQNKPDNNTFVPMYPSIEERIHDMQQRRINACVRLPPDHPLQPSMIEPIQFVSADAEGVVDQTGSESANINVSLSSFQTTTKTNEPSIIQDLMNHYSGELPGYETNLERASDLASGEVMIENPQQQTPNLEMASLTHTDSVLYYEQIQPEQTHPKQDVLELSVPEQDVPELSVPEQDVPEQVIINRSPVTNTIIEPKIATNDQPSSSNLALQTCAPARPKNIPSPPTLFLVSTILANVCENIFQELNKLIEARNNLVHVDKYHKQWRKLRERVHFVLSELQRSSFDAQGTAHNNLQD